MNDRCERQSLRPRGADRTGRTGVRVEFGGWCVSVARLPRRKREAARSRRSRCGRPNHGLSGRLNMGVVGRRRATHGLKSTSDRRWRDLFSQAPASIGMRRHRKTPGWNRPHDAVARARSSDGDEIAVPPRIEFVGATRERRKQPTRILDGGCLAHGTTHRGRTAEAVGQSLTSRG